MTLFRWIQGVYWLGLGVWLGAIVMLVVAAAITFGTVRQFDPTLGIEPYHLPDFADRSASILAGGIVGNLLSGLAVIQSVCAAAVVGCVVLQCTMFAKRIQGGMRGWPNVLRLVFIAGPIAVLAVDTLALRPRILEQRQAMYDLSTTDEARAAAKSRFDRLHKLDERMVGALAVMLVGAVFASAFTLHGSEQRQSVTT